MKVIDLLNKIANREEVPKKIEYEGEIYEFNKNIHGYWGGKNKDCFRAMVTWRYLNNEVEILEEEKKTKPLTKKDIEALGYACCEIQKSFTNGWKKSLENKSIEEEKKIPEKLKNYYDENLEEYVVETYIKGINYKEIFNSRYDEMIISKINEVLDYLQSKGE